MRCSHHMPKMRRTRRTPLSGSNSEALTSWPMWKETLLGTLRLLCASLCALLLLAACARPEPTPAAGAPTPAAPVHPTQTARPAPTPSPTPDIPFEESIEGRDLVKYQALPPEFQDAFQEEAKEAGNEKAVQYLRDLPAETVPITELLDPNVLSWLPFRALDLFNQLDAARHRSLLLGGYADAFRHHADQFQLYADEHGEEELDPKGHAVLFAQMVELAFQNDTVKLPPLKEILSVEALAKLDALDALMHRAFRRAREQFRGFSTLDLTEVVASLESGLLAAPTELPSIEDIGVSTERMELFKQLPADMQDWLWEDIAGELVRGRDPRDSHIFGEESSLLEIWSTPAARATSARGYLPAAPFGITHALACLGRSRPGSVRVLPGDLPDRPVFLPPPQEVLSSEALDKFNAMDPLLQRAFNESWLSSGPVMPEWLACEIGRLELGILAAPVTTIPALETFLPSELSDLYQRVPTERQRTLERELVGEILAGRTHGMMYPGFQAAPAPFGDADLDAFFDALGTWFEWRIWGLAMAISGPTAAQEEEVSGPPAEGPSEVSGLEEDLAKYRTLPAGILEALRQEIERVPLDSRPTLPGPVSIQDVLAQDEQDLFDRLPVALKEMFWRVVARELVYGSAIQTAGGKIIRNVRTTAKHWVRFASQVPTSR